MKRIFHTILTGVVAATIFMSCKKDAASNSTTTFATGAIITQGTWKVTLLKHNGADETTNYTGYQFNFTNGGYAAAIFNGVVTNGSWDTLDDDSQNKLDLKFGTTPPLDHITEDWHVTGASSTMVTMEHVSGGNGGTDYLTIQKL